MQAADAIRQDQDELLDDIMELERVTRAGIAIGNASDELIDHQYAGLFYVLEPDGSIDPDTNERADILIIGDRMEWQRAVKHQGMVNGPLMFNRPRVIAGPKGEGAAPVVARELLAYDRLGKLGCYLVRGDDRDEERRSRARQRWIDWRTEQARDIQRDWIHRMEGIVKSGGLIPVQNKIVREAIAFLEKLERGEIQMSAPVGKRFRSLVDGADFDTLEEALDYNERRYRDKVGHDPEKYVRDTVASTQEARPKRRRIEAPVAENLPTTRPRAISAAKQKELKAQADDLLAQAEALGIDLTVAEIRAVLSLEQKTIRLVASKVLQAAAEPEPAEEGIDAAE